MSYGFVYILVNEAMTVFKVGCTERAPHARAAELSNGTAVPVAFEVMCYAEFEDFQAEEMRLHEYLSDNRVSPNREFFWKECLNDAVAYLFYHPRQLGFTDVGIPFELDGPYRFACDLPNPWKNDESNKVIEVTAESQSNGDAA